MKKVILILLGFVITLTGFSAFAVLAGCCSTESKCARMGKVAGMHRGMPQLDDIDKLLILVSIEEKKQMYKKPGMPKTPKMQGTQKPGMPPQATKMQGPQGRPGMQCPMNKNGSRSPMMSKRMKGQPRTMTMRHGSGRHHEHGFNRNAILKAYLLKNYSKEIKALAEQKKDNDNAAKEVLEKARKLVNEAKAKMKAEHEEFAKMISDYKKSKDPKLAGQIKAKLSEFYDMRLAKMKEKIDNEYRELKKKRAEKDIIISKDFERITK
jgi:hypothetical protein